MNTIDNLFAPHIINENLASGTITRSDFDALTKDLITLEKTALSLRQTLQSVWAVSGMIIGQIPVAKPANIGVKANLYDSELWIDLPVVLPHTKELGKSNYITGSLLYSLNKLEPKDVQSFQSLISDGYVMIFEFLNDSYSLIRAKDVDNVECISITNAITAYFGVPDDPGIMSQYRVSVKSSRAGTRVGVMPHENFIKYLNRR